MCVCVYSGRIYCSPTTAALVKLKLGVKGVVIPLELEVPHRILVAGSQVGVILTDANHCPGAVCLLFELPGGKVPTYPSVEEGFIHMIYIYIYLLCTVHACMSIWD